MARGQEGDKWIGDVEKLRDPTYGSDRWPEHQRLPFQKQDNINREHMNRTELQPQYKTFSLGLDFIEKNTNLIAVKKPVFPFNKFPDQTELKMVYF